jgi:MFS family permease
MNKFSKVLMTASLIWYFGEGMLGPLFAIFAESIGGDVLEITWAWAIYLFVTGIFMIFIGRLSDKYVSKEKLMITGYALNTIFTFGYLFVSSPWHLFIVQAGLGIAWSLGTPTWDALYARHEDKKHDGSAWGFADGLPAIITGLAIVIGGLIVTYLSFKTLFIVMGIIQIIATLYQTRIFLMKDKKKKK